MNPVRTIGDFMTEGAVRRRVVPHELSGGMLQRVMIATVLASESRLIITRESTTALDLVTQAEFVAPLWEAREKRGASILFISHDLELAAATCDRMAVMYAGSAPPYTDAQAQVLNLIADIREREQLSFIVITHDLAVANQICDHLVVLRAGRVVETGSREQVLLDPQHPYTRLLRAAVPREGWTPPRLRDLATSESAGGPEAGAFRPGSISSGRRP